MSVRGLQKSLSILLTPFGMMYGLAMRLRRRLWNVLPRFACPCACVSVGNIAWGGTGKTPLTEWLMHWAAAREIRAVVLSRGYKARLQHPPVVVSPQYSAASVGDEPLMLALSCPQAPVLVDPKRRRAAALAVERLRPELMVLDDGFQHVAVKRNLDLVLLRPEDLRSEWNRVIPAGSWREPWTALHAAGAFLIKCPPEIMHELTPAATTRLEAFGRPLFSFELAPVHLRRVGGEESMTAAEAERRPYALVTGVGNPEQVTSTVSAYMGYAPDTIVSYPDHHRYTSREAEQLAANKRLIICTAKDAAKLRQFQVPDIWYLRTEVRFGPALWADKPFPGWWEDWWNIHRPSPQPR